MPFEQGPGKQSVLCWDIPGDRTYYPARKLPQMLLLLPCCDWAFFSSQSGMLALQMSLFPRSHPICPSSVTSSGLGEKPSA